MKLISVIVPVYNLEQYIVETIQSVLAQTYKHFELIVIDDGSTDKTPEICEEFQEPKLKLIRQRNKGANAARNAGVRAAKGDYIAFLDGDDLWFPEKLAKHIEHLEQSPEVGISYSQSAFIDEAGNPMGLYQMPKLTDITVRDVLCRNPISNGSCAVLRQEVFEGIKFQDDLYGTAEDFYWDERLQGSQDLDCWFRIALKTDWKMEGIPEILTLYRVNSHGLSANLLKKQESWEQVMEKTREYAPDEVAQWENPARAYHLRYLARRAVTLRDGMTALKLCRQAIATHPQMVLEEPKRTGVTLVAATILSVLPTPIYQQLEDLGMKVGGWFQKRQIFQYKT
ncbi:glycosyltransferase family 2 protein [Laspinema olomoucense]|uniref:Glycosyltransferase family 2 protein n=1 Tax=Laspinema olomoucense D3b TaxID=2953688 RepID=A0ABT2NGV3_9CYAN|nr:glycosyltransferase family A protein [Laspinema sp. D3b]MCT7981119.1 glycosyltransferase family 2 protein [Laspinema sp. D3b]